MSRQEVICIEGRFYVVTEKDINHERTIFYGSNKEMGEIVVKVLGESTFWSTREARRKCILTAYRRGVEVNGEDIYLCVAPIGNVIKDKALILGPPCTPRSDRDIKTALFDTLLEYALVMRRLPLSARLDELLDLQDTQEIEILLQQLVFSVKMMHVRAKVVDMVDRDGLRFGCPEQVMNKLKRNICSFERSLVQKGLRERYADLLVRLRQAWEWEQLPLLLEWRSKLNPNPIIEGHGDLHLNNIFRLSNERNALTRVVMLDLIDFNDDYFCMDRLSDVAMLIVEVEALLGKPEWRELMMRRYLEDEANKIIARYLLRLYMLEKAMVRATVGLNSIESQSIAREDKRWEPISRFLSLADRYMYILESERYAVDKCLAALV
jgi:aminoglycoside phosphotransferase family enzyme